MQLAQSYHNTCSDTMMVRYLSNDRTTSKCVNIPLGGFEFVGIEVIRSVLVKSVNYADHYVFSGTIMLESDINKEL